MDRHAPLPAIERLVRNLTVTTSCSEGNVRVPVADRGKGIVDSGRPYVFDPVFTTKTGGLGMGPAICRRVAESCGGRIRAENSPEGGAAFHFELAVAAGGA